MQAVFKVRVEHKVQVQFVYVKAESMQHAARTAADHFSLSIDDVFPVEQVDQNHSVDLIAAPMVYRWK